MGSWNGTCHFSNMSIMYGEKIVIIPISKTSFSINAIWLPVRGIYNDYGSIENIETNPWNELLFEVFKKYSIKATEYDNLMKSVNSEKAEFKKLILKLEKDNIYGPTRLKAIEEFESSHEYYSNYYEQNIFIIDSKYKDNYKLESIEDMFKLFERGFVSYNTTEFNDGKWFNTKAQLDFIMIKEEVFNIFKDKFLTEPGAHTYWGSSIGLEYINSILDNITKCEINKKMNEYVFNPIKYDDLNDTKQYIKHMDLFNRFNEYVFKIDGISSQYKHLHEFNLIYNRFIQLNCGLEPFFKELLIDIYVFNSFNWKARKPIHLTAMRGDQQDNVAFMADFYEKVAKVTLETNRNLYSEE